MFDILKHTTDAYLFCQDLKRDIIMFSPNFVQDFALPGEIFTNSQNVWEPFIHPNETDAFGALMQQIHDKRSVFDHALEFRIKNRKGNYIWVRWRGRIGLDKVDGTTIFTGTISRLSTRNQADEVTGLLNKYRFEHTLRTMLRSVGATGESGAIILLGADNFKIINETHNRIIGDEFLRRLSRVIENLLPPELIVYKYVRHNCPGCRRATHYGVLYRLATQFGGADND